MAVMLGDFVLYARMISEENNDALLLSQLIIAVVLGVLFARMIRGS